MRASQCVVLITPDTHVLNLFLICPLIYKALLVLQPSHRTCQFYLYNIGLDVMTHAYYTPSTMVYAALNVIYHLQHFHLYIAFSTGLHNMKVNISCSSVQINVSNILGFT